MTVLAEQFSSLTRRALLALGLLLAAAIVMPLAAKAATPAESFVQDNISRGLAILNDKALTKDQRRDQFEKFLFGLTDMKALAMDSLGIYRRGASQTDLDAFTISFQNYYAAVFQSYFDKYTNQTLKVIGSQELSPDEISVTTQLINPADKSGNPPLQIVFHLANANGRFSVKDASVAGVRLLFTKKSEFASILGNNDGKIPVLVQKLDAITANIKSTLR
jgi:phospholipid transport system substrate-binding protein